MSIVCGTDFSESSQRAVQAAADLAVGMKVPLHLAHAVELNADSLYDELRTTALGRAKDRLIALAEQVRARGASVSIHVEQGPPDEALEALAKRVSAQLIVVAALGHRREARWQLGSHAERLANHAHVPVLVVRNAELFHAWVQKRRPLRVLLGIDMTSTSDGALGFIAQLRKFGQCEIIASHLYWPPTEFQRLGLSGVRSYLEPDPEVTKSLTHDFEKRMHDVLGEPPARLRLEPHIGSLGDRLALVADEEHADLIVVGSHDRNLPERIVHGSVSRAVVQQARVSVACVPSQAVDTAATPVLDSVIAATDFSPTGDAAVALAYAAVADGGTVHLVHVVKDETSHSALTPADIFPAHPPTDAEAAARFQLLKLMSKPTNRAVRTRVHILRSNDAAQAICQAAERLDAALICAGSHGSGGLARTLLGSTASSLLSATTRPVLLARAPRK